VFLQLKHPSKCHPPPVYLFVVSLLSPKSRSSVSSSSVSKELHGNLHLI
jgi:hypothetical protein